MCTRNGGRGTGLLCVCACCDVRCGGTGGTALRGIALGETGTGSDMGWLVRALAGLDRQWGTRSCHQCWDNGESHVFGNHVWGRILWRGNMLCRVPGGRWGLLYCHDVHLRDGGGVSGQVCGWVTTGTLLRYRRSETGMPQRWHPRD